MGIIMKYVILCATWYHLYNFKNVKNTHGGVLLLVKMQGSACKFTKSNTLAWVFCTFLKFVYCANGTKSRKVSHTKYTAWNIHHHIIFFVILLRLQFAFSFWSFQRFIIQTSETATANKLFECVLPFCWFGT